MLRSSSFAAFDFAAFVDLLRTCCSGPPFPCSPICDILRVHAVHCGSNVDLASDAIVWC